MAIGSHQSSKMQSDEWLTPPEIIEALGPFDLDPCSLVDRPWPTARKHYTINDNGLFLPWKGRIFCNPPYGKQTGEWLQKMASHNNGIALVFARTETAMFFSSVWGRASAVMFIKGRLHFYYVDGTKAKANSGGPSCLVAYGENNVNALRRSGIDGITIPITNQT